MSTPRDRGQGQTAPAARRVSMNQQARGRMGSVKPGEGISRAKSDSQCTVPSNLFAELDQLGPCQTIVLRKRRWQLASGRLQRWGKTLKCS